MADKYLVQEESLTSIADAVRSKAGTSGDLVFPQGIVEGVNSIPSAAPNGTSWEIVRNNSTRIGKVVRAMGLWVGVTWYGGPCYSLDGRDWESTNVGGAYDCLYYANGIFVASGSDVGISYSTDGKTWKSSNLDTSKRAGYFLYEDGVWLAWDTVGGSTFGIHYSMDGKTWSQSNIATGNIQCIRYAKGLFVAASLIDGLYYSTDGITWTQSNITGKATDAFFYNGLWIAGDANGSYYSEDGKVWTKNDLLLNGIEGIYDTNRGYLIAAVKTSQYYNSILHYSTDGKNWTICDVDKSKDFLGGGIITYGGGLFAMYSKSSSKYFYSSDGKSWTYVSAPWNSCAGMVYGNGVWVAANTNKAIYTSTDGVTWTRSMNEAKNAKGVICEDGVWLVYGSSVYYSPVWNSPSKEEEER